MSEIICITKSCKSKEVQVVGITNMKFKGLYRTAIQYYCQKCKHPFTILDKIITRKYFKEWKKELAEKAKKFLHKQ